MEVKNQAMDQLLVNTVQQPAASQNAKAGKDADRPDFDAMVQKRTAEKDTSKTPKTAKTAPVKEKADAPAAEEAPVTDGQYAIAAALMMQTMPDGPRVAQIQPELIAAENTATVQAVLFDSEQPAVETTEQLMPEIPVETVEAANAQTDVEAPAEVTVEAEDTTEIPTEAKKAPIAAQSESKAEADEAPKAAPTERRPEQAQRTDEDDAPRIERPVRLVRSEERTDSEEDVETDPAQAPVEAPVFERVDAPMVKVAEAPKAIELEADDGMEQLGEVIVNSVDANRVEVQLTPENLGKLTVEITRGNDGTISVVLHTETQRAANLLEKSADGLRQALAGNRQQDVQIEVRGSEESQRQFLNPDGQNEQNRQQQQQQRNGRHNEQRSAQDFLQQLRLGLVDADNNE